MNALEQLIIALETMFALPGPSDADAAALEMATAIDNYVVDYPSSGITQIQINQWNTAFSWGDHALAGYLKADGSVDLTSDWIISTNNITLTGGTLTANAGAFTGTGAGNGIEIGGDVNLYRGGANALYLATGDDLILVDGHISVGNVTVNAWNSGHSAVQLGNFSSIFANNTNSILYLSNNTYLNESSQFIRTNSTAGTLIQISNDRINFNSHAAGTIGTATGLSLNLQIAANQVKLPLANTASRALLFGGDAALYRSAADVLSLGAGDDFHLFDNDKIIFGTGSDTSIFYDGSDLWIKANDVGSGELKIDTGIVLPKTTNVGIKVDTASPTFGWRDIWGDIKTRPAAGGGAAAQPDYVVYRGNIYGWRFGTTPPNNHIHEAFIEFQIPHDYVPGTDIFIHVHWSQIVVDTGGTAGVPGVARWDFDVTYAKGFGTPGGVADPFIDPITLTVLQQGSTTQYGHMIIGGQLSAASPTASQLDSDDLEIDGLILVRVYRNTTNIEDTLDQDTFLHFMDIHYQSTNIPTKNEDRPFYA